MTRFAVLVNPSAVFVKDWAYFLSQGGRRQAWGRRWRPILARDIESARRKGQKLEPYKSYAERPFWAK